MNGKRRLLAVLLALMALLPLTFAAAEENLLLNGDFAVLDEDGLPVDWYTDAYIMETGYTVFSVREGDEEHPRLIEINNIGNNDARFAQMVDVEPETLYCLSGYVRAEGVTGGHGANLSVEGVYAFSEKVYNTAGEWKYIEYYGETGPDQREITVFARVGGYSGESKGKAAFANLSLRPVDSVPGDGVADLWFVPSSSWDDDGDLAEEEGEKTPGPAWPWLLLISGLYAAGALAAFSWQTRERDLTGNGGKGQGAFVTGILLAALALRVLISALVEGYMVDVNCFLSWGATFAAHGPTQFYQATNFCDYPPLYTYVLGLNSVLAQALGGGTAVNRIVFRLIPSLCDLAACFLLYRLLEKRGEGLSARARLLFLFFLAFNPATVLNSAAWGQMDSVLCLLLLGVAVLAVEGRWAACLPLYVVSVLVKPQALMLGPLGLFYIVIAWIREKESRKKILLGVGISLLTLAAGVIPFSLRQNWDWLIQLYSKTLASYPYATVNTANFYYLLGGNWSSVTRSAPLLASLLLGLLCLGWGAWWLRRAKGQKAVWTEAALASLFAAGFVVCACIGASWAWVGGLAMAFAFVVVLCPAIRSGEIRLLPWLGAVLFILLYVFGVKMHERYLFPALLLLALAWVLRRDRRILSVLLLYTITLFLNEGIVLDNSIRLGSNMGHLNADTVWLAALISIANVLGALYAVYLTVELLLSDREISQEAALPRLLKVRSATARDPLAWKPDRSLNWTRRDSLILLGITAVYSVLALTTLGSARAPQNGWTSSSAEEQVVFDLGQSYDDFSILYFGRVSHNDFSVSASEDGEHWEEETWAQMDQGQCWKWKYVTVSYERGGERTYYNSDLENVVRFSGRYVRLSAQALGLTLNEALFRDAEGGVIPATVRERTGASEESELYSDPAFLLDEPDTLEPLPSFLGGGESEQTPAQPSWWNSTYFDEIYHARTAYEFLQGSVPYETSHPPLGKVLMSLCVAVFGMTPFGWRFAGALAGILMLPGMYLLGKQLTKKTSLAALACGLMALDCQHLTQTQIATIDSFPVLFIIFAFFFMLRFLQTDFLREKLNRTLTSLGCSGLFMGLAIASKWIGIYAGAGLAVLFFGHCVRVALMEKEAIRLGREPGVKPLSRIVTMCLWCLLFFVVVPVVIYLLSYIPYLAYRARRIHSLSDYIAEVWRAQVGMFNYHSTPNLGMDHPFYSPWWEWPIIRKPMYYAAESYLPADSKTHFSIFCFGNPVIWYSGLAALCFCLLRAVHNHRYTLREGGMLWHLKSITADTRYAFLFIGLLAQYLPWVLVPRGTYIYHYFASVPFLMLGICLCFDGWSEKGRKVARIVAWVLVALSAICFIILLPYACGIAVPAGWLDLGKKLLRIWY